MLTAVILLIIVGAIFTVFGILIEHPALAVPGLLMVFAALILAAYDLLIV